MDLRLAADRAAAMLEPLLEDREVSLTVNGRAPLVLGDVDRLQQVVTNLVDNASRIVGEGGHVRVELNAEGDRAVLSVLDDGPGIPEADLPRLFDRFYRADSSRTRTSGGAGLGLAIVRAIVVAHGGRIEAANLPEGGARMTVSLPALEVTEPTPPATDELATPSVRLIDGSSPALESDPGLANAFAITIATPAFTTSPMMNGTTPTAAACGKRHVERVREPRGAHPVHDREEHDARTDVGSESCVAPVFTRPTRTSDATPAATMKPTM